MEIVRTIIFREGVFLFVKPKTGICDAVGDPPIRLPKYRDCEYCAGSSKDDASAARAGRVLRLTMVPPRSRSRRWFFGC